MAYERRSRRVPRTVLAQSSKWSTPRLKSRESTMQSPPLRIAKAMEVPLLGSGLAAVHWATSSVRLRSEGSAWNTCCCAFGSRGPRTAESPKCTIMLPT